VVTFRAAVAGDAGTIAALHAESWRNAYRGIYADHYLDHEVLDDRLGVWRARYASPDPNAFGILAMRGDELVGFAYTILDEDAQWGALLDNLHVRPDLKRGGVGTALMAETAREVIDRAPGSGLYLWVLEENHTARAFYGARGGVCTGREVSEAPGGGDIVGLRYSWPDPVRLTAG
jgi:GNAT superfamily N-acetyltransferase